MYHRLDRMEWLEWEVRTRDLEVRNPRTSNERRAQLMVELPTLTEAWYYLAFRTMRLIKRNCPELDTFDVLPITLTRNKLIEHDHGVFSANIATEGVGGPTVKGPRWDGQSDEWPDPGLFVNAASFDAQLRQLLDPYVLRDVKEAHGLR